MFLLGLGASESVSRDPDFQIKPIKPAYGTKTLYQAYQAQPAVAIFPPTPTPPPPAATQVCWDGSSTPVGGSCPPMPPPNPPAPQPATPIVSAVTMPQFPAPGETQQPTPGMTITTSSTPAAALFSAIPRWGWGLGAAAIVAGTVVLWRRSRR